MGKSRRYGWYQGWVALLAVAVLSGVGKGPAAAAADKGDAAKEETKAAAVPYKGPKKRLGVMDLEVKITATSTSQPTVGGGTSTTNTVSIPPPTDFGTGLTEMLTTALVDTHQFVLLERKALADIQAEQQLGASGQASPMTAAGRGKLVGAQALVRGAVTEYAYNSSSVGGSGNILKGLAHGLGVGGGKTEAKVVLDIRLYDSTTGQIMDSVRADGRAVATGASVSVNRDDWQMAGGTFRQTPLGQATREAIAKAVAMIVKRMEAEPWEGRLASVDTEEGGGTTLYINAGKVSGLKVGDRFDILRPGHPIVDPTTQTVLGRAKDKRIGACVVESLTDDLAAATPTEGQGFQVGDVVAWIPPKE